MSKMTIWRANLSGMRWNDGGSWIAVYYRREFYATISHETILERSANGSKWDAATDKLPSNWMFA